MPPREATGSFPDQFLLFDYDSVIVAPATLPPTPQPQPSPPHNSSDHANGNGEGESNTDAQANHSLLERATGAVSPVDPLSIDPTTSDNFNNNNMHILESSRQHQWSPSLPNSNPSNERSWNQMGARPFPARDITFSSDNVQPPPHPQQPHLTNHQHHLQQLQAGAPPPPLADPSASPLSTGSSVFQMGSTTASSPLASTIAGISVEDYASAMDEDDGNDQDVVLEDVASLEAAHVVTESEDASAPPSSDESAISDQQDQQQGQQQHELLSTGSEDSNDSLRMIYRNVAFDGEEPTPSLVFGTSMEDTQLPQQHPASPRAIMLSFGNSTTVDDLKYFAERGCIVALLEALKTPRLVTLGTRMLADYAKMAHRRVAVASNKRILDFIQKTMLQVSEANWMGREYAVETVRSLTATEASDRFLMNTPGLLKTLALVSTGGPFVTSTTDDESEQEMEPTTVPLASEKAQLHACIAIMNLSCGKANKMEIAQVPSVLEAMRDVMLGSNEEACLKATTCIKNLSNADANDAALLGTSGLAEALGHVAATTCSHGGATISTTNACLALMNLSISKSNKHKVFRTPGVMESLMTVLERTRSSPSSTEARVKACSALSNLAIGYDNKIPMFHFPGFVSAILNVISTDTGEARTKACSILWSFAAEIKNQVPVVERGDILPVLVRVAEEDVTTEARFKCVAALTLLAESLENAVPLLHAGALVPLMDILQQAGADPTQWKGQTASWCVGFLMNISQSDEAVPILRQAGVVELLAPLLTLDHYQSLKAAIAVTFCCRFDKGDECYDLLRKTESVIPKIITLLHNTLAGRGGNGYKYGVFILRVSVGCIAALACGPDFMKERIATSLVFESLLRVVCDFCVDGGTTGAIVGGGREDTTSAKLAVQALQALTSHLIPNSGGASLPFGPTMDERLLNAYEFYIHCPKVDPTSRQLAADAKYRMEAARSCTGITKIGFEDHDVASMASNCCGALEYFPGLSVVADDDDSGDLLQGLYIPSLNGSIQRTDADSMLPKSPSSSSSSGQPTVVRTFLLADSQTGLRYVVPTDPDGGRMFNDNRRWCYRRGRYCDDSETPDPSYVWTPSLQQQYEQALSGGIEL